MIFRLKLDIPILFVDTGVMFQETLDTRDRIAAELGLDIRTLTPELTMAEQTEKYDVLYICPSRGKNSAATCGKWNRCCAQGAVRCADRRACTARTGDGAGTAPVLAIDVEMNAVRINPLANFTDEQLDGYLAEHKVIVNPLHAQGFSTISCNRCTTPVMPGEPKRAGRWRHLGPWSTYCGIDPTDLDDGTAAGIDLPQDLIDRILGQKTDFMI